MPASSDIKGTLLLQSKVTSENPLYIFAFSGVVCPCFACVEEPSLHETVHASVDQSCEQCAMPLEPATITKRAKWTHQPPPATTVFHCRRAEQDVSSNMARPTFGFIVIKWGLTTHDAHLQTDIVPAGFQSNRNFISSMCTTHLVS